VPELAVDWALDSPDTRWQLIDGTLSKFGGDPLLLSFQGDRRALRVASAAVEMRIALRRAAQPPRVVRRIERGSVGLCPSGRGSLVLSTRGVREVNFGCQQKCAAMALRSSVIGRPLMRLS
jgi:hypothetical protein